MFKHNVGLFLLVLMSSLVFTGVANAHYYDGKYRLLSPSREYIYESPYAFAKCYTVDGKYHKYHACALFDAKFACTKYVYFANPIHTDKQCSAWTWVPGERVAKWHKYYYYHKV